MTRQRLKKKMPNNPINLIEQGEVSPLPYETMQDFWLSFFRTLQASYRRYVDFYCMVSDMTFCYKPEAKEYALKVERFMKVSFIFWSFGFKTRSSSQRETGNCLKLAYALGVAYGFEVDEYDVKNALYDLEYEKGFGEEQ